MSVHFGKGRGPGHMNRNTQGMGGDGSLISQMPSGVIGLWTMDHYSASPRATVVNQAATAPVPKNLMPVSRRKLTFVWGNTGCTVTDGVLSPIDGTNNATTVTWGAGDNYLNTNIPTVPPSTQVTLSFDLQTTDASTVSVRTGNNASMVTISVTPTMQRFSTTFNISTGNAVILVRSLNSATPANLKIDNVTMHLGAVDLGREALAGHIVFGTNVGNSIPGTSTPGLIDVSAGQGGPIQFNELQNLAAFTVIAIGSRAALTSYGVLQSPVSAWAGAYTSFTPAMDNGSGNGGYLTNYIGGSQPASDNSVGLNWPRADELHGIAHRYGDGFATIFQDDIKVISATSSALNPGTIGDFWLNWVLNSGIYSRYKYAAIALWPRALSDSELVAAYNTLKTYCSTESGLTVNPTAKYLLAEGDSITEGVGSADGLKSYANRAGVNLTNTVGHNSARASSTLGVISDTSATNSLYGRRVADLAIIPANKAGRSFVLSVLIGRNDGPGFSAATYAANVAAYIAVMKAGGYDKAVLCTCLPSTSAGFNTWRAGFNAIILAPGWAAANGIDAIVDFDAVSGMGADADASNVTNYPDGTHPSNTGYTLLEPAYRAVINAL